MLKDLLTSLAYQMLKKDLKMPGPFKLYLEKVSDEDFMADLTLIVKFIESPKQAVLKGNHFFKALVEYFTDEFAQHVDSLDSKFYLASVKDRQEKVQELVKDDSPVSTAIKKLLVGASYQQLCEEIGNIGHAVIGAAHIIVQSPREIDLALRKDIRKKLTEESPMSFPVFQINKKLIGGVRVFKNGEVIDHSWLSRVLRFTSLTAA